MRAPVPCRQRPTAPSLIASRPFDGLATPSGRNGRQTVVSQRFLPILYPGRRYRDSECTVRSRSYTLSKEGAISMSSEFGPDSLPEQESAEAALEHRISWFSPDRPVSGGTVYVRSDSAGASAHSGY
jgi:hypothetical protein